MTAVEADDEIIGTLSDYLDGALPAERAAEVEKKLATDDAWKRAHADLRETRDALSGLQKARAPATFVQDVTATIHNRSAGAFFGRRTFGDRVPFNVLLVIAVLGLAAVAYILWSSQTGTLKVDPQKQETQPPTQPIVPLKP
jgi:anti-sigma factor RsiW